MKLRSGLELLHLTDHQLRSVRRRVRKRERSIRGLLRKKALRHLYCGASVDSLGPQIKRLTIKEKLDQRPDVVIEQAREALRKRFTLFRQRGSGLMGDVPVIRPINLGAEWTEWNFSSMEVSAKFARATASEGPARGSEDWTYELVYRTPSRSLDARFRFSTDRRCRWTECFCQVCLPDSRVLSDPTVCVTCENILSRVKNKRCDDMWDRQHLTMCKGPVGKRFRRRQGQIGLDEWRMPVFQLLDFEEFASFSLLSS